MKAICPGQDTRFWKPDDIFELPCPACGQGIEFFKDDVYRRCGRCGTRMQNPQISRGCAQWCAFAKDCLGYDPKTVDDADEGEEALLDRLVGALRDLPSLDPVRFERGLAVLHQAQSLMDGGTVRPVVLLGAALCGGADLPLEDRTTVLDKLDGETRRQIGNLLRDVASESPEAQQLRQAYRLADLEILKQGHKDSPD